MNFVINQMTSLRYFLPLVTEGNRRGVQSRFFVSASRKYNCAIAHIQTLSQIAKQYQVLLYPIKEISNHVKNPTFFAEDHEIYNIDFIENKKYSITTMDDFQCFYNKPDDASRPGIYVNHCDHVIMPSKFMAEYYDCVTPKNLYFGSPKYDIVLKKEQIYEKYGLDSQEKYALLVFPRIRDVFKLDLLKLYPLLRSLGYKIIVKTRGKDRVPRREYMGDHYFEDFSWYPHTTMELIQISNFIVNFDSTTIKECVMLDTPLVNFHVKPFSPTEYMGFLYDYPYCKQLSTNLDPHQIKDAISSIEHNNYNEYFKEARKKHLFESGKVSEKILDFVLQ